MVESSRSITAARQAAAKASQRQELDGRTDAGEFDARTKVDIGISSFYRNEMFCSRVTHPRPERNTSFQLY
jgi:hypothetical protein